MNIDALIEELSLDDLIGQLLCFDFGKYIKSGDFDKIEEISCKAKPGGFFISTSTSEQVERVKNIVEKYAKLPPIVAADIECGPGPVVKGATKLPQPMAWGACDDAELIEKAHNATAEMCRQHGVHWSFSPIVDINMNMNNPVTNIRAISDSAKQVVKIAGAAIRGMQKNGLMAAGCKHFPGDGVDDRNQHFCTTVNSLSKEEWMKTFGYVYKELIEEGASTIMVGHIALPAFDEKLNDWVGYPPATISYNLQTKLLKEELGFKGCIVSDAMSMIGVCSAIHPDRVAVEFIKAGGDMILFPLAEYYDQIREAVEAGEISIDRIKDAARRVFGLKEKVRLFENQDDVLKDITHQYDIDALSQEIADKSVTLIRNFDNNIPVKLNKGDKVLLIMLQKDGNETVIAQPMRLLKGEFEKRGFEVSQYINPTREDIAEDLEEAKAVFVNIKVSCRDWNGGGLRVGFPQIATLWRGAILRHPKCVFTSFGDPYKLYEFPYVKNYINVYSETDESQRAFVKAILGEIPIQGKSPVTLKGFFDAEV